MHELSKDQKQQLKIAALENELSLYKTPNNILASMINPQVFADTLLNLGWHMIPSLRDNVAIFQIEKNTCKGQNFFQAHIPLSTSFGDYSLAMYNAAKELGNFKGQEAKQVLVNLILESLNCEKPPGEVKPNVNQ